MQSTNIQWNKSYFKKAAIAVWWTYIGHHIILFKQYSVKFSLKYRELSNDGVFVDTAAEIS